MNKRQKKKHKKIQRERSMVVFSGFIEESERLQPKQRGFSLVEQPRKTKYYATQNFQDFKTEKAPS